MGGGRRKPRLDPGRQRELDEAHMRRCLVLAARARGRTAPNPMVGCVIVDRSGAVIAEGFHARAGLPHAEANALAEVAGRAPGCTMYVNLEPCAHRGNRRTEPCAPKVLASGIARLVIGMGDPIPSHAGGARYLARNGIEVVRGILRAECIELNRPWLCWAKSRRPLFVLKAGVSLDGRVATRTGESQWITGPPARREVHALRNEVDGIVVGVGTVRADDPRLTVRGVRGGRDPVRVVVDSELRTPPSSALLPANTRSKARAVIATTRAAPHRRFTRLAAAGAEIWRLPARGKRVDLRKLATRLADEGLAHVLVEGGPTLHAAFVEADLADEIRLYMAGIVLGGEAARGGPGWVGGAGVARLASASRFQFVGEPRRVGSDVALTLRRGKKGP